jgi:hypothetical protein
MICLQGQDPLQDQIRMYVAPNSSVWDQNRSHGCCSGVCFSNGNGKEDGELVHIVAIALEIVKERRFWIDRRREGGYRDELIGWLEPSKSSGGQC